MTVVIISEGIDLSVGSLPALTISGMAVMNIVYGIGIYTAMVIAIISTVILGMINGMVIQYGKVPAFITTLGMMGIVRGFVLLISRGNSSIFLSLQKFCFTVFRLYAIQKKRAPFTQKMLNGRRSLNHGQRGH